MNELKVYWRPGCSSCVRVKEFLAGLNIPFESVNVSSRPEAMEELRALGVRTVPVVARGREFVFAQELADVSRFLGRKVDFARLPAPVLMEKWLHVLRAAQAHIVQMPAERLGERATEGRDRSIRDLAYHVYQVPDSFLQLMQDGVEDLTSVYNAPPPPTVRTAADIREYGSRIERKLAAWWEANTDLISSPGASGTVKTYYGVQPLHHLLERCTWHSAQHARQIVSVLERFGIAAQPPLGQEDYAGLPMPAGLWE